MQPQTEDEVDEEFLDDPIKLYINEETHTDFQIIDPNIIDLDSEIDIIDISQSSKSSVFGRSDVLSESTVASIIKDLRVPIVDINKYPWYYKKHLRRAKEIDICVTDFSVEKKTSAQNITSPHGSIMRSIERTEDANTCNPGISSGLNLKIKYDALKKGWMVEKRMEVQKRREDIEKQKAISQRNVSRIDFKRNKGLVGLTITQRIVNDNTVVVTGKDKANKKIKAVDKNDDNAWKVKSDVDLMPNTSKNNNSTSNTAITAGKGNIINEPDNEIKSKHIKCSLKMPPGKKNNEIQKFNENTKSFNKDFEIQSSDFNKQDCNKRAPDIIVIKNRENIPKLPHLAKLKLDKTISNPKPPVCHDDRKSFTQKCKNTPKSGKKTKEPKSIPKIADKAVLKKSQSYNKILHEKIANVKNSDWKSRNITTMNSKYLTNDEVLHSITSNPIPKVVDIEQNKKNNAIDKDENKSTNEDVQNIIKRQDYPLIGDSPLRKKLRNSPITSTYIQHLNHNNDVQISTTHLLDKDNTYSENQSPSVNIKQSKNVNKATSIIPPTVNVTTNSDLPSTSILKRTINNLQEPSLSQNGSKKLLVRFVSTRNSRNSVTDTRTTVVNKELNSIFVHGSEKSQSEWCHDSNNLKQKYSTHMPSINKNLRISRKYIDLNRDIMLNASKNRAAAIKLRPQNHYQLENVLQSNVPTQSCAFAPSSQMQGNINSSPIVNPQSDYHVVESLHCQSSLQQNSLPKQFFNHNSFASYIQHNSGFPPNAGIATNAGPPGICDINPNAYWAYAYQAPIAPYMSPQLFAPPPPPPPPPIESLVIDQNLSTVEQQTEDNSIIGRNNGGVVKKISIAAMQTVLNSDRSVDDTKDDIVKVENSETYPLPCTTGKNVENNENSTPITSKQQMLEELNKLVTIDKLPHNNDFHRPIKIVDKSIDMMTTKIADTKKIPVHVSRPERRAGPLSKKRKLNPPCFSTIPPETNFIERILPSKGYSPPILPIPTYQNILSKLPVATKLAFQVTTTDTPKNQRLHSNILQVKANTVNLENKEKSKKISLEDYKKRVVCKNDTLINGQEKINYFGKLARNPQKKSVEANDINTDQDLGYDSDTNIKL